MIASSTSRRRTSPSLLPGSPLTSRKPARGGLRFLGPVLLGIAALGAPPAAAQGPGPLGPDVIVSSIPAIIKTGTVGDVTAYAMATTSCNVGDMEAIWEPTINQHPVIAQNFYRLEDSRLEMIGLSWLKHAFCATNEPWCGACQDTPCNTMGINCADTYGAVTNAQQQSLGPRSEVNPVTGAYPFPYGAAGMTGDDIYKRLQIHNHDLDPALHPGAQYFAEAYYVTTDEPTWGTNDNNASYIEVNVGNLDGGGYQLQVTLNMVAELPALFAWQAADSRVQIHYASVPGDGTFILGSRAADLGNGTWDYEYALYNYNSHRAAGSVTVPLPPGSTVTGIGFHDVDHHSGEPYAGTDWPGTASAATMSWATVPHATDPDANAVRWGTLYNYRFICDQPPTTGELTIGLFAPGSAGDPDSVPVTAVVPGSCATPLFVRGDADGDGQANIVDAVGILGYLFNSAPLDPPVDRADADGDGTVNITDPVYLLLYLFSSGSAPPAPFPDPGCL